jgi:hypothetical protein
VRPEEGWIVGWHVVTFDGKLQDSPDEFEGEGVEVGRVGERGR